MTRTWPSTITYWVLAVLFVWGIVGAVSGALQDLYPTPWRYTFWWAVIALLHLTRQPWVILVWLAFFFDLFEPLALLLYGTQSGALLILGWPFVILGLLIYLWRRGEYARDQANPPDPQGTT